MQTRFLMGLAPATMSSGPEGSVDQLFEKDRTEYERQPELVE
jgi:hypothetical protein